MKWPWPLALGIACLLACEPQPNRDVSRASLSGSVSAAATGTTRVPPALIAAGVHFLIRHTGDIDESVQAPMVLAIHGLGDAPDRFAGLLDALQTPARIIFPRGLTAHGRGFSWFGGGPSRSPGIRDAAARLAKMIDVLTERYPTRDPPIVTGFSQGGMLAYALAVRHGTKLTLAIPVSGALPPSLVPLQAPAGAPPIFGLHGDADAVVPIAATRTLTQLLRERGYRADLTEYPGIGHTVSPAMHRALLRHLHDALTETEPPSTSP